MRFSIKLPIRKTILLVAVLSPLFVCPSIQAQKQAPSPGDPSVDAPQMIVGEQWVVKNHRGLRTHRVIEVEPDGKFVVEVKDEDGQVLWHRHYDVGYHILGTDFKAPRQRTKPGAPWERALNFPLFVGKKWQDHHQGEGPDGILRTFDNTWEVEAIETVDAPAGTFSTFKIHRNFTAATMRQNWDQYYWYAPEVKIVVKMLNLSGFRNKKGVTVFNDLVSYQPAAGGTKILTVESKPAAEPKTTAAVVPAETSPADRGGKPAKPLFTMIRRCTVSTLVTPR